MSEARETKTIACYDYTDLTDTEAFDLWLSECPVNYNLQEDDDDYEDEDSVIEIYAFELKKEGSDD